MVLMQKSCASTCFTSSIKHQLDQKDLFDIEQFLGLEELVLWHCVQSRWLSLVPVMQCLLHIKDTLKKLLLEELPKQDKKIKENEKYLDVKKGLESKEVGC